MYFQLSSDNMKQESPHYTNKSHSQQYLSNTNNELQPLLLYSSLQNYEQNKIEDNLNKKEKDIIYKQQIKDPIQEIFDKEAEISVDKNIILPSIVPSLSNQANINSEFFQNIEVQSELQETQSENKIINTQSNSNLLVITKNKMIKKSLPIIKSISSPSFKQKHKNTYQSQQLKQSSSLSQQSQQHILQPYVPHPLTYKSFPQNQSNKVNLTHNTNKNKKTLTESNKINPIQEQEIKIPQQIFQSQSPPLSSSEQKPQEQICAIVEERKKYLNIKQKETFNNVQQKKLTNKIIPDKFKLNYSITDHTILETVARNNNNIYSCPQGYTEDSYFMDSHLNQPFASTKHLSQIPTFKRRTAKEWKEEFNNNGQSKIRSYSRQISMLKNSQILNKDESLIIVPLQKQSDDLISVPCDSCRAQVPFSKYEEHMDEHHRRNIPAKPSIYASLKPLSNSFSHIYQHESPLLNVKIDQNARSFSQQRRNINKILDLPTISDDLLETFWKASISQF